MVFEKSVFGAYGECRGKPRRPFRCRFPFIEFEESFEVIGQVVDLIVEYILRFSMFVGIVIATYSRESIVDDFSFGSNSFQVFVP